MQFWASFGTSFLYYSIRTFSMQLHVTSASEKVCVWGGLYPSPKSGGPIPLPPPPLLRRLWMWTEGDNKRKDVNVFKFHADMPFMDNPELHLWPDLSCANNTAATTTTINRIIFRCRRSFQVRPVRPEVSQVPKNLWCEHFTCRMPYLSPSQQCQVL